MINIFYVVSSCSAIALLYVLLEFLYIWVLSNELGWKYTKKDIIMVSLVEKMLAIQLNRGI